VDTFINNHGAAQINHRVNEAIASAQSLTLGANQGDKGTVSVDTIYGGLAVLPDCERNTPGDIYVGNRGSGTLTVTNGGKVWNGHCYIAAVANPDQASNGAVTIKGEGSVWILAGDECSGGAGLFIGSTATSDVGGTALLDVRDGAMIEVVNSVDVPDVKVGLSGTLTGNGLLILSGSIPGSDTAVVLGTLAPGGTLRIAGNLRLELSATTVCSVTPQASDNVQVVQQWGNRTDGGWGHATLDGKLSVTMTGDFTPGTSFTLVHADAGRSGTFHSYSIKYNPVPGGQCFTPTVTYDANNVYLYLEPCTQ